MNIFWSEETPQHISRDQLKNFVLVRWGKDEDGNPDCQFPSGSACVAPLSETCTKLYAAEFDEIYTRTIEKLCAQGGSSCHSASGAQGGLVLETETRRVTLGEQEIELTAMEFELLRSLMESRGRVLSRDTLLRRLRGIDAEIYDRSVDMLVSRLRKKLEEDSRSPRFIKTIRGTGYQFVGGDDS